MNVKPPSVSQFNRFTLDQVRDLTEGGVAVSDGKGNLGILKTPKDRLPPEWQNFKGQLPDFRPMSKAAVVGALRRAAGISDGTNMDDAAKHLGERLKEILMDASGTPAAAARAYLRYQKPAQVDSKAARALPKGDAKTSVTGQGNRAGESGSRGEPNIHGLPAQARAETQPAPSGEVGGMSGASGPAKAGLDKSKAQLTAFIGRQAFAVTYPYHIGRAVSTAVQAAHQDPEQSAKLTSGTLTAPELEVLARIGMNEVRASVRPSANDDE